MAKIVLTSVILTLCVTSAVGEADAVVAAQKIPSDLLAAEHRSEGGRSAEPDSFLDRIADLFGGAPKPAPIQNKVQRRPVSPVYPGQAKPNPVFPGPLQSLQSQPSILQPQSVKPPAGFNPKRPVTKLQSSPSNAIKRQSAAPDAWANSQPANMAQIQDLEVQCEKDLFRVRIKFDRPFYGMVFSKGFYSNVNCVHVPAALGQTQATFDIAMGQCGMSTGGNSDSYGAPTPQGSYIENTIIIQYDPLLQEVWDQARKIRCTWYDFYEKAVTFKPYQVDMLDPVTANFLGDNLRCWMQIQVGKGPYASEVSGIVKIGQTMTMVLGVKDDENKFDMMVRNCVAHDGQRAPIQLVDEKGCVVREKIMSPFKKIKNFDTTANVLSYAYFQAFKFPDSMNVHFQCVVQVCRNQCPEPQCGGALPLPQPSSNNIDSYGAPAAAPISNVDSYGSPLAPPNGAINPRTPPQSQYSSGSQRRVSVVTPGPSPVNKPIPLAGYNGFNKRTGVADVAEGLGGRPRSLEFEDGVEAQPLVQSVSEADLEPVENVDENKLDSQTEQSRRRRSLRDANGNRVLAVRRVKRETVEEDEAEEADIETERIIQVVSPSDVQFKLAEDDKDEVVINLNSVPESLCLNTAAFIGVTVTFVMLLIVASIVIIFLWLRIRTLTARKNLL